MACLTAPANKFCYRPFLCHFHAPVYAPPAKILALALIRSLARPPGPAPVRSAILLSSSESKSNPGILTIAVLSFRYVHTFITTRQCSVADNLSPHLFLLSMQAPAPQSIELTGANHSLRPGALEPGRGMVVQGSGLGGHGSPPANRSHNLREEIHTCSSQQTNPDPRILRKLFRPRSPPTLSSALG
jgi:hypothetical protein